MTALAGLVRAMNCYYSNLIEGHDTHPIDIERALNDEYSADPKKRDLQLEAKAHIAVQQWIDEGGLDGRALTAESAGRPALGDAGEHRGEGAGPTRRIPHTRRASRAAFSRQPRRGAPFHGAL